MFKLNGKTIRLDQDLVIDRELIRIGEDGNEETYIDAVTIPAAHLSDPATRAELGIVEEPDPVPADERFYWNGNLATPRDLEGEHGLRKWAIAEVKRIRQSALDTFPKSSGVAEVYAENLRAAQAVAAGNGGTTTMRDGATANAYLATMAAGMGITAAQFSAYVIAENTAAATKAREIEAEYIRVAYSFIPTCSFEQVQTVADGFRDFCAARTAS